MPANHLYYGDNLDILRDPERIRPHSVDLVYLDPPFNSDRVYNVLFDRKEPEQAAAQMQAFTDTWTWTPETERVYLELLGGGAPLRVAEAMQGFHSLIGENDLLAYLVMMAPRLVALYEVLKPTGSLYLHCDPTASHYLKILLDAVFGVGQFRNEIVWRRTGSHGKLSRFGPIHDTLLFYTKSRHYTWNGSKRPYMKGHVEQYFAQDEHGWHTNYYGNVLTGSGTRNGESGKPWRGFDPTAKGRHWAIPGALVEDAGEDFTGMTQHEKLDRLYELGYIKIEPGQAWPMYEHRLKPEDGTPVPDIWAYQPYTQGTVFGSNQCIDEDVRWLSTQDQERLGYPTQKPLGLLRRIIEASSNPGDFVLDPFCGCGTTVDAAQALGRQWAGIDITFLAIDLIVRRLRHTHGSGAQFEVNGIPKDVLGAQSLFNTSHFEFERWAVSLVDGEPKDRPGGDKGVDGIARFPVAKKGSPGRVIISVKGGASLTPGFVRDLDGTVSGHKAEMGLLITLHEPTDGMRDTANHLGNYTWPVTGREYRRIQIVTIAELLSGKPPDLPPLLAPYIQAKRAHSPLEQLALGDDD